MLHIGSKPLVFQGIKTFLRFSQGIRPRLFNDDEPDFFRHFLDFDNRPAQEPGWFSNKSCKMRSILPFLCGCCSETEVSEQL
jgi:hypothetical protein